MTMSKLETTNDVEFLKTYNIHDYDVPLTTVDMAIFSIVEQRLHVLVVTREEPPQLGRWALPGGFIDLKKDVSLDAAAHRKLFEKTAIASPYLEQVQTVGDATRDPRGWSVTALYFALIDHATPLATNAQWLPVDEASNLDWAFDHQMLLRLAVERLRSKTLYTALPIGLMPELFTLTELQQVFEVILGHGLEKKSFRRRVLDAGVVQPTELSKKSGKRSAQLYRAAALSLDFVFPRALDVLL